MKICLKTFASIADVCGFKERTISVADGSTPRSVLELLIGEYPKLSHQKDMILVAVNEVYADLDTMLFDGDELALFPPVSGG